MQARVGPAPACDASPPPLSVLPPAVIECAMLSAWAAGTPLLRSVEPTWSTLSLANSEPMTARPRLAAKLRTVWVMPVTSP